MALDKNDFSKIEKIVHGVENRLENRIERLENKIEDSAKKTKIELREEIHQTVNSSEKRVIAIISREITDLAEINKDVIQEVDKISDLEKRIIRIERKIGIVGS